MKQGSDWWVYMLRCADGTLYTGVTTDVLRRWNEHNGGPRGHRKQATKKYWKKVRTFLRIARQ